MRSHRRPWIYPPSPRGAAAIYRKPCFTCVDYFVNFYLQSLDIPPSLEPLRGAAAHRAQRNTPDSGVSPAQLDSGEPAHGDGGGGRRLGGGLRLAH